MFEQAKADQELDKKLREEKVIFFLNLLGIDNNGHAFRPSSPEYLNNIAIVDSGVEQIYHLIEKYFNYDNRTSYVFTADHGMSNKGSHGDSLPDNTDTPLICKGKGRGKSKRKKEGKREEKGKKYRQNRTRKKGEEYQCWRGNYHHESPYWTYHDQQ